MRKIVVVVFSVALVLVFAAVAAAGPRDDQYGNQVAQVTSKPKTVTVVAGATLKQQKPTVAKAAAGALPFTGLQLGIVFVAGVALLGAGIFLRRMGRPDGNDSSS